MPERDRCTAQLWDADCARAAVSAPPLAALLYQRRPLSEHRGSVPGSQSPQAALKRQETGSRIVGYCFIHRSLFRPFGVTELAGAFLLFNNVHYQIVHLAAPKVPAIPLICFLRLMMAFFTCIDTSLDRKRSVPMNS